MFDVGQSADEVVDEASLYRPRGSHEWLVRFIEHRVGDPRMIRLIRKWLKAGVMEDGERTASEVGTPQEEELV